MKSKLAISIAIIEIIIILMLCFAETKATPDYFGQPNQIRCTCYCVSGTTASGKQTRPYIVAGKREWLGCVAALYEVEEDGSMGNFIGYYEFLDTGAGIDTDGDGYGDTIINGESIDVWQPTYQDCVDWVAEHGDYVYMKIIRGEG